MRQVPIPTKLSICEDYQALLEAFGNYIKKQEIDKLAFISGEFSKAALVGKLIQDLNLNNYPIEEADYIVGIGGGKSLDKAKLKAKELDKKFISIPTLIGHDGICSPVAVIDGESYGAVMPEALFVPLYLVKEAPIKQIQAGIGDLISNLSAIEDWKLACAHGKAEMDDFAVMLSRRAAMNVIKSLEQLNSIKGLKEKNFLKSLVESLALSGIAMSISGNSRPCSGAEHMISHAIDEIFGSGVKAPHGIQVLVATLYLEKLRGYDLLGNANNPKSYLAPENKKLESRLGRILKKLEFPTLFKHIGINEADLEKILELAPKTRPGRFSLLNLKFKSLRS